jgi:hypothetical protein
LSLTAESVRCICGHPTPGIAWEWAPGHQGGPKCICCMRAIWEESLETIQAALAVYPAVTQGECASGVGLGICTCDGPPAQPCGLNCRYPYTDERQPPA